MHLSRTHLEDQMRKLVGVLGLLALTGCTQPAPPPPVDTAAAKAAVERTITVWFDSALATLDTAALRAGLAVDFAILEDSVWYDRDSFVTLVAELPKRVGGPFTLRYDLSDWRTMVEGNVAWTSLTNRAVLTPANGAVMRLAWRETVVLRRRDSRWLIVRYQSAPIR
jgi:ketosteroid isomerase-like protein